MNYFDAILIAVLVCLVTYINVTRRNSKPVGGLLINVDPNNPANTYVGVAFKDVDVLNDISTRKYVVLEVNTNFNLKQIQDNLE